MLAFGAAIYSGTTDLKKGILIEGVIHMGGMLFTGVSLQKPRLDCPENQACISRWFSARVNGAILGPSLFWSSVYEGDGMMKYRNHFGC